MRTSQPRYTFIGPYLIPCRHMPLVRAIQNEVARFYNIPPQEMFSARRDREVARPRQVAMYLSKRLTLKSLPTIARAFRRDHTTVIHALRAIELRRMQEPGLDADIRFLTRRLGA